MAEEACMSLKFVRAAQAPTSAHLYVYPATFQLVNNRVVRKIFLGRAKCMCIGLNSMISRAKTPFKILAGCSDSWHRANESCMIEAATYPVSRSVDPRYVQDCMEPVTQRQAMM